MVFAPKFLITAKTANALMRVEAARQAVQNLPVTPSVIASLRETARLLSTLVLHLDGYDLKGLYSLEEYYARNLDAYYQALSIGPTHNYYDGRAQADITRWVEYFCGGVADSFESVQKRALAAAGAGAQGIGTVPYARHHHQRGYRGTVRHFPAHRPQSFKRLG